jgi:hypothetical protein
MRIIPNLTMPACQSMFPPRSRLGHQEGGKHRIGREKERREGRREEQGGSRDLSKMSGSIGPEKIERLTSACHSKFVI